jgi:hypothetical protein
MEDMEVTVDKTIEKKVRKNDGIKKTRKVVFSNNMGQKVTVTDKRNDIHEEFNEGEEVTLSFQQANARLR